MQLCLIALLITTGIHLSTSFHEGLPILKGRVVAGIYYEEIPQPFTLYEKSVPLIFEFRIRSDIWSNFPGGGYNKLKLLPRLNCRTDNKSSTTTTSDWLFTCPTFYHVHEFLKYYKSNFTDVHPIFQFRSALRQNLNEYQKFTHHPLLNFEDCTWKGIYGRDMGLVEYRSLIEKCNNLPIYYEDQITDYSHDIGYLFDGMRDNFMNNFFLNVTSPDPGVMINDLLAIQSLHLINTHSEITRLDEALLSCQNQLIPYSFLKGARLEKALLEIKTKLIPLKYTLPSGLTISKLLKLPVADCIFGTNTLTVQVLLPVIRAEANYALLKFFYPNFLYDDQLCNVKSVKELTSMNQPQHFLYDRSSKTLLDTNCISNEKKLCFAPDQTQRPLVNKCIYEVLNSTFIAIRVRDFCPLYCEKLQPEFSRKILPIIQRVAPTRFLITLSKLAPILIKCEGKPDEMITPQSYGSVEISLPCNCYLMYHHEKFHSRVPCGMHLSIEHVIPDHMVNSSWNKESKFFHNAMSDKVNFSMFSEEDSVSLLDFREIINVTLEEDFSRGYDDYQGNNCFEGHVFLWIFVSFQSIVLLLVIIYLLIKVSYLTKRCEYGRGAVCFSVSQMTNLDDNK